MVKAAGVIKERKQPCRSDLLESDPASPKLSERDVSRFRSMLQNVAYAREGRPDLDFAVCSLQRAFPKVGRDPDLGGSRYCSSFRKVPSASDLIIVLARTCVLSHHHELGEGTVEATCANFVD